MKLKELYSKYIANNSDTSSFMDVELEPDTLQVPFLSKFDYDYLGLPYLSDFSDP